MIARTFAGAATASVLLLPAVPIQAADIIVISDTRTVTVSAEGCERSPDGPVCTDDFDHQAAAPSLPFNAEATATAPYASARALQLSFFETDHMAVYTELEGETSADSCTLEQWSNADAATEFTVMFEVTDASPYTLFAALGTFGSPPGALSISLTGPGIDKSTSTQGDALLPVIWTGTVEPGVYVLAIVATHHIPDLAGGRSELSCVFGLDELVDPGPPANVVPYGQEREVWWEGVYCDWRGCITESDFFSANDFDLFNAASGGAMQLSLVEIGHFSAIGRVSASPYALTDAGASATEDGYSTYIVQFIVPAPRLARVRALVGGGASITLTRHTPPDWTIVFSDEPFHGFVGVVDLAPGTYSVTAVAEASAATSTCQNHAWGDELYTLIVDFFEDTGPDLNWDGVVDGADLGLLLAAWGPCSGCPEDLNGDGVVDGMDLGLLLAEWS